MDLPVDHVIYAVPELSAGITAIEDLLGVRAAIGGKHVGLGTHNALLALGPSTYLEIIAPDPEQDEFRRPRIFGIDDLTQPRLVAWVARADDLDELASRKLSRGQRLGEVLSGSRKNADGATLTWRFTDPFTVIADGVVPFFIDWGASPHPAKSAPPGANLVQLRAEHPDPDPVRQDLETLGLDLPLTQGAQAALVAEVDCPEGLVELR
jgi:hypothetical protein